MPYSPNIPQPSDFQDDSQADILQNFQGLDTSFAIDHYTFSDATSNNGKHKAISFPAVVTPAAPTNPASNIHTELNAGTSDPLAPNLFFSNSNTSVMLNAVKAFAVYNGAGTPLGTTYNVSTLTNPGTGQYVVTLLANAVKNANFLVLVSGQMASSFSTGVISGWDTPTMVGTQGRFELNFRALTSAAGATPARFSFAVLQW